MRKDVLLPALAILGGGAGFVLRRMELGVAYDPVSRLMSMDHPLTWLLIGLTVVLLAAFVLTCRGVEKQKNAPQQWFSAPGDTVYMMLIVSAALLLLACAGVGVWDMKRQHRQNLMLTVSCVLCVLGSVGALAAGRSCYRKQWSDYVPLQLMGPAFCTLAWLVVGYQEQAREPEVQLFAYQILGAVAVLLSLYGMVSLSLKKGNAAIVCVYGLMGIFLSLVTLADGHDPAYTLMCLFSVLYLTAQMYLLLRNAFGPAWPKHLMEERMPRRAEEEDEDDDEENGIRPLFGPKK